MTRDGAHAGDVIAVTGYLGDSAGGLRLLLGEQRGRPRGRRLPEAGAPAPPAASGRWPDGCPPGRASGHRHQRWPPPGPGPRLPGQRPGGRRPGPGVPMSPALRQAFPQHALALACGGGEDYQLLLAAPPDRPSSRCSAPGRRARQLSSARWWPTAERRVRLLDGTGRELSLPPAAGWDHLREAPWRR